MIEQRINEMYLPAIRNRDEWYCVATDPTRMAMVGNSLVVDPNLTPRPTIYAHGQCEHCGSYRTLSPNEPADDFDGQGDDGTRFRYEPLEYDETWQTYACGACRAVFPIYTKPGRDLIF